MKAPQEAFDPPEDLTLSKESRAATKLLYSADASRKFGPGARLQVYLRSDCVPRPRPPTITIMVFVNAAPEPQGGTRVYPLLLSKKPAESKFRYDEAVGRGETEIGTVYFPKSMFPGVPPQKCFLQISKLAPNLVKTDRNG